MPKRRTRKTQAQPALRAQIPKHAIEADPAQQVPNNSYSPPPRYYIDQEFQCMDCGRREVWTAGQQKWYYEVAKGSLYSQAVRCKVCRRKHRETHSGQGDPNPIKHPGSLRKELRNRIDSLLTEAGFQFDRQSGKEERWSMWMEYASPTQILRCTFDGRRGYLTADALTDADWTHAVDVEMGSARSTSVVLERLDEFTDRLSRFVRGG